MRESTIVRLSMPLVRASYCKSAIAAAKKLRHAEPILDRVGAVRSVVREAGMLGWVDINVYITLTDATLQVLGPDGACDFWAERLLEAFYMPLMRPLVEGGLFLFGKRPGSLIRMTPKSYPLIYKGCGLPSVSSSDRTTRLTIADMPSQMRSASLVQCFRGHCYSTLRYCGRSGKVTVDDAKLDAGTCTWVTTWE